MGKISLVLVLICLGGCAGWPAYCDPDEKLVVIKTSTQHLYWCMKQKEDKNEGNSEHKP